MFLLISSSLNTYTTTKVQADYHTELARSYACLRKIGGGKSPKKF